TSVVFSAAIQYYKDTFYIKSWRENWQPPSEYDAQTTEKLSPRITFIDWVNEEEQSINDTIYNTKVGLKIGLSNPNGGSLTLKIKKKDGTSLDDHTREISIEKSVEGATVFIKNIAIQEHWQNFKNAALDELVVTAQYNNSIKEGKPLPIVSLPKVIVGFRPSKNYDGEYGFDYMRDQADKKDKLTYKDILGTNYEYDKTKKKWVEKFKKYTTDTQYNDLKDIHYKTITFPWYKDAKRKEKEYLQSWLSMYPKQIVTLSLQIETIENPKKLDLTFEYDKTLFKLNTDTLPAQRKGKKRLKDHLTIECLKAFSTDQTIKVIYQKRQLGQLNILKNNKANRKKVNVVFVEVETELVSGKPKFGNIINKTGRPEKEMLTRYLQQAYTKLELDEITFNLTQSDPITKKPKYPDFNKNYTLLDLKKKKILNKYHNKGGDSLAEFMEKTLNKEHPKYKDYFKVFFFGDRGGRKDKAKRIQGLAGYAKNFNTQSAIMFAGKRKATVTHELLHCMGLRHSFDDRATYGYKKKATQNIMDYSSTRTHIWLWQWKKLWKNKHLNKE
ncbi:hypothetical protein V2574_15375, partial [Tenacibaculum maritimum]